MATEDFVMVEKSVVGGLTANVQRWRGRASAERLKRQRWRKRALAAEAEVKRLREAVTTADEDRSGMTMEGGGMKPSRDEIAAAIRAADIGGYGSTVDHEEAAENVLALLSSRCLLEADHSDAGQLIWKLAAVIEERDAELGHLRAVVQAEIVQHFKVQDKHGQENAGSPYCAADSFLWPCPVRRRLEAALDRKDTA